MAQFTEEQIETVWCKAIVQSNNNPDVFRQDYAGAWIKRNDYGNRDSEYGWEIDHLKPVEKGGTDEEQNLYQKTVFYACSLVLITNCVMK